MAQRHTVPPESSKEQFILGLNMAQLMWAAGGITLGFGGFFILSRIQSNVWISLFFGLPPGLLVLPFMFYRPKKGTLSFAEFIKYRFTIKKRNNKLPNKRSFNPAEVDDDVAVTSPTISERERDVRNIDITLGGGN